MTETPDIVERIWCRDLDGTGSMHPCSKGDPGAVEFIPADAIEHQRTLLRKAVEALREADEALKFSSNAAVLKVGTTLSELEQMLGE